MNSINSTEDRNTVKLMAKEFLEYRLGVEATESNVRRFAAHIIHFERELNNEKWTKENTRLMPTAIDRKVLKPGVSI